MNTISSNKDYVLGLQLYQNQKFKDAVKSFSLAIEKEENPEIYYQRAICFFHLKQNDLALEDLNIAVELDNENPFRFSSRAYVKDMMGDTQGAINDYRKAIELDPEDAVAFNNLGLLEEKLGWKEKAKKNFEKADEISKNSDWFNNLNSAENKPNSENENTDIREKETEGDSTANNLGTVIKGLINSAENRREFFDFVKNGFKLPQKK